MAETAKITTLYDHDTDEAIAPRTDVKALSGEGKKWNYVGFTDDNTVGVIDGSWPCNRNLLNNACWDKREHVVNQRNVNGLINATGYFIDRWRLTSGTVEITDGGLVLDGTMVQILENDPGKDLVASVLTSDDLAAAEYSAETKTFTITAAGQTLIAAKLELGTHQTLAHKEGDRWVINEVPNYSEELLKCRRYFLNMYQRGMSSGYAALGLARADTTNKAYAMVPIDCSLRATPTATMEGQFRLSGKGVQSIGVNNYRDGLVCLTVVTTDNTLTVGEVYILQRYDNNSTLYLDAELG